MNYVFADTFYWIAIVKPNDSYHEDVKKLKSNLGDVRLVTTEEVLAEFLTVLSRG
jgi:predicted nucleic acid-binding protein